MKIEEWERSHPEKKHILRYESGFSPNNSMKQGQQNSFQSGPKKTSSVFIVACVKGVEGEAG